MVALHGGEYTDVRGDRYRVCRNAVIGCNWIYRLPAVHDDRCFSCALTRRYPTEGDDHLRELVVDTSRAKRWLVFQLDELGLPIVSHRANPEGGLAFDLDASDDARKVVIGHQNGVITIDVTEAADSHREALRALLGEPYRTMLGHFRHEIGHYYWLALVADTPALERFREVFGDERQDYGAALDSHYAEGGGDAWGQDFISQYATTHPWEDFAETFAHYLHITDTLQSAAAFRVRIGGPDVSDGAAASEGVLAATPALRPSHELDMPGILAQWLPTSAALNLANRSMGKGDLYPFVIPPHVADKLSFVHDLVRGARS